jgi:hypothetical protein
MKKAWAVLALLALFVLPAAAQSNAILDQILENPRLNYGQAAYLVLTASGKLPESVAPAAAADALEGLGWRIEARAAEDPVSLGEYSWLLMRALELKGGVFYHLFPGPRYAARELAYRRLIQGKAHPGRPVGGEEAVRLLAGALELKGGRS